jgi:Mn-dependent DtxR family transcriptional regulator
MNEKYQLTMSLEDYLKRIYLLQSEGKEVRVTDIAAVLNISKPSVNRAINMLREEGFLEHEHYGTILLTEKGEKVGRNMYETHKVIKRFLIEILDVDPEIAEKEACLMEHSISKGTKKKWKKFLKKELKNRN